MAEKIELYRVNIEGRLIALKEAGISPKNAELIAQFVEDLKAEGLTEFRLVKYLGHLRVLAERLGTDLDRATEEDLRKLVSEINTNPEWEEWTKQNYKVALKRFYRWLYKGERDPEITAWIKTTMKNNSRKLPEEMLTEEEALMLIGATPHTRDKALIALLWDAGLRIGEAGTLRIKNIAFDEYGAVLTVRGKTGARRVRIIWSLPFIRNWLEEHPLKEDPEAPLWIKFWNGDTRPMNYAGIRKQLLTAKKKAGLKKRIHAHIFRHSSATRMASHLTEAQMKEYFGWVQGSDMASVYVHLSGRDVDKAVLEMHGIKMGDGEEAKPKSKGCPRCRKPNPRSATFCLNCGAVLNTEMAAKEDLLLPQEKKRLEELEERLIKMEEVLAGYHEELLTTVKGYPTGPLGEQPGDIVSWGKDEEKPRRR